MFILLWVNLQQPVSDPGVQEQLPVHHLQEEQDSLQGLQAPQVPHGRHVQVRLQVRQEEQLVQDTLHHAEPTAENYTSAYSVTAINSCNILAPSLQEPSPLPSISTLSPFSLTFPSHPLL